MNAFSGLLTNFVTVRKSLDRLKDLDAMATDGRHERLTKKEVARLEKERGKLDRNLRFRRSDPHLGEIEEAFNEMTASLRERVARGGQPPVSGG